MKKYHIIFLILSNFFIVGSINSQCDTINYPLPRNWSLTYYWVGSPAGDGYVAGTNGNYEKQKANYFDLSASSVMYIQGALFYFGVANSSVIADLAKNVMFKVYADVGGSPGNQIGSTVNLQLSSIKANVDSGIMTHVIFPTPIALPSSKKFYVSVDVSNFSWSNDSITLLTTTIDNVIPGTAWEQESDNTWKSMNNKYGNLTLICLPYVSTSLTGCSTTLSVKLLSFNAEKENNDVLLNWQTSDEFDTKEYEVQKANNNNNFKTVDIISALNDFKIENYTFKDINAFISSLTVQYRLKQINKDGEVQYSKIILMKDISSVSIVVFPDPYNNVLKLQVNTVNAEVIKVNIYDNKGSLVASEKPVFLNGIVNTISVPSATKLKNGVYFLKLSIGNRQFMYRIEKE